MFPPILSKRFTVGNVRGFFWIVRVVVEFIGTRNPGLKVSPLGVPKALRPDRVALYLLFRRVVQPDRARLGRVRLQVELRKKQPK